MISRFTLLLLIVFSSGQIQGNSKDSVRIHNLIVTGTGLLKINKDSAIRQYEEALALAKTARYMNDSVASVMFRVSGYFYYRGKTAEAISLALSALTYYRGKHDMY